MADDKPVDWSALLKTLATLQPPPPLDLVSVESRGVPDQERIYLKANQRVSLREYFLVLCVQMPDGTAYPSPLCLWLGNGMVEANAWVIVYTGAGSPLVTKMQQTGEPTLVLYWAQSTTLFNAPQTSVILVHTDKVQVLPAPTK